MKKMIATFALGLFLSIGLSGCSPEGAPSVPEVVNGKPPAEFKAEKTKGPPKTLSGTTD